MKRRFQRLSFTVGVRRIDRLLLAMRVLSSPCRSVGNLSSWPCWQGWRGRPSVGTAGWVRCWSLLLLLLVVAGAVSCSSTREGSKPFAAVTLRGSDALTIRQTVESVFSEKGFWDASRRDLWCYERGTSKMGQLLHGGWFDDDGVRERVKLKLIPLSEGVYRLEAEAVMVRDAGDAFFEEEARMTRLKSGPYRKLLAEVEKRLRQP